MGISDLITAVSGDVFTAGDDEYDEAREVWNARFLRNPSIVVRCIDAADVAAAVRYSRDHDMTLSVKGGGHSYGGRTVAEDSLLIDLSVMKDIRVDAGARIATVGPGVTGAELDAATQAYGLATPTATVSSVGIAGATLGGGTGNLTRKYGLMADNLIGAEVVTADGRTLRASSDENQDMFWGLRGAGANLGVVTSFDLRLHKVGPEVLSGQVIYPFDNAAGLLRFFREFMAAAPDELQVYPFMFLAPPIDLFPEEFHGKPVLDFVLFHLDPTANDAVQPLRNLGETVLDFVAPTAYSAAQQAFDANLPKGQRYYSKAHYVDDLTDELIDTVTTHIPLMRGAFSSAYFERGGGARGRIDPAATAFGHRDAGYSFHVLAGWMEADQDDGVMGWARGLYDAMKPHATGGVYVNLLAEDDTNRVAAAYGANYERLANLKESWDPSNVFRMNYNVAPSG